MILSKRKARSHYRIPFGRCAAHVFGLVLIAGLAMGRTAGGAERPEVRSSADPKATIADDAGKKESPRARRFGRASADDVVSAEGQRKRSSRNGSSRGDRRAKRRSKTSEDGHIRLHLSGSFELDLGNDRVVRGEGSSTIDLDRAAAEKLRTIIGEGLDAIAPVAKDLLKVIVGLPETLESTGEILKILADPDTQKSLRQVEQLLRLLQQSPGKPDSGK